MVSAAFKYVPQPVATTFVFTSVFIFLLWVMDIEQGSVAEPEPGYIIQKICTESRCGRCVKSPVPTLCNTAAIGLPTELKMTESKSMVP